MQPDAEPSALASAEPRALTAWMSGSRAPAERLEKFRAWLVDRIGYAFAWPDNQRDLHAQIHACTRFVDGWISEMERDGWLFEARGLFEHVTARLESIAKLQRAGLPLAELSTLLANVARTWRAIRFTALRGQSVTFATAHRFAVAGGAF
jgi:hypothetical protein